MNKPLELTSIDPEYGKSLQLSASFTGGDFDDSPHTTTRILTGELAKDQRRSEPTSLYPISHSEKEGREFKIPRPACPDTTRKTEAAIPVELPSNTESIAADVGVGDAIVFEDFNQHPGEVRTGQTIIGRKFESQLTVNSTGNNKRT